MVNLKKVLLTGASGFIGRHAIQGLVQRGYEVHAISRQCKANDAQVAFHQADLFDIAQLETIIRTVKPSYLLHLAWDVEPATYMKSLGNFRWVRASMELLEFFQFYGGVRAVVAGTCAEYDWRYGYLSEKLTPQNPSSNYGIAKHALHEVIDAFSLSTSLSLAWGRIFFLFGPYEAEARLVSSVIRSLLADSPACCTHGKQYRDFLYVEDVADAFCALLDSNVIGAVNIASGEPLRIRELVQIIADIIGKPELLQMGVIEARPDEPSFICANTDRLANEVGWKPGYEISEGIEKTISWWKNRRCTGTVGSCHGK